MPPRTPKSTARSRRAPHSDAPTPKSQSSAPAAATHRHAPGNLPLALSRFIGRERELTAIKERLGSARLLTLTGTGGSGKTRLALEVGASLLREYSDGVWLVEFAPLTAGALVPFVVASALGVREQPGRPITETLTEALHSRAMLVIFNNCEHLVTDCASLAQRLLQVCPKLKILATSREPLGVMGEVSWNVPPLAVPRPDQITLVELSAVESLQLFVDKASAASPDFELTERNAPLVAQICRDLDGLPLAIELAAARCRSLSLQDIAARLGERFILLTMGQRTAPPRHQTLQATIEWSYALLNASEREVFRKLAVFAGGWTLEAAEAACEGLPTLDLLSRLVDKSLVIKQERDGDVRYSLLETIREYAWDRLREAHEIEQARNRHLDFYLNLAEQAAPWLRRSEELVWLRRLRADHDNLRAALSWSLQYSPTDALRMVTALYQFWFSTSNLTEGSQWTDSVLVALADSPAATRARALIIAATFADLRGEGIRAVTLLNQGLDLFEQIEDEQGIASSWLQLGITAHHQGDRKHAIELLDKSLAKFRQLGDNFMVGQSLLWLADAKMRYGDLAAAREHSKEAFTIFLESGERVSIAFSLGGLGEIARLEGNYADAARLLKEALEVKFEIGAQEDSCYILEALAHLAAQTHAPDRAARLWGATEAFREFYGAPLPPSYQTDYAPLIDLARQELGASVFSKAWSEGRAMTFEQAVAYALGEPEMPAQPSQPPAQPRLDILTPRELEVLRLITAGLSNREIAEKLVLSIGTVKWYTTTIYAKLGVQSRTQAIARARELSLV